MIIDIYGQGRKHYLAIDAYKAIPEEDVDDWKACAKCDMKPMLWIFDNGRKTACGCGKNKYDHLSIFAESISSVLSRGNGNISEYREEDLRDNWNHWVETGEILFKQDSGSRW